MRIGAIVPPLLYGVINEQETPVVEQSTRFERGSAWEIFYTFLSFRQRDDDGIPGTRRSRHPNWRVPYYDDSSIRRNPECTTSVETSADQVAVNIASTRPRYASPPAPDAPAGRVPQRRRPRNEGRYGRSNLGCIPPLENAIDAPLVSA